MVAIFLSMAAGCQWFQQPVEPVKEESRQTAPTPQEESGFLAKVVAVSDGDTIIVLNDKKEQLKIRLATIDAPEHNQRFGNASKKNLSSLVFKKDVRIIPTDRDKYGRTVAIVMLDGVDISLEQIRKGLAWHYKRHAWQQTDEMRKQYSEAEDMAREEKLGLWVDENPVPPWQYRKDEEFIKEGSDKPVKFN